MKKEKTTRTLIFCSLPSSPMPRALLFRILKDRERPLDLRLAVCLALAHDLQVCIHRNTLFQCDDLFARYDTPDIWNRFQTKA
ncbi:hypothetical protein [uncultured Merdimonas sp.]|uniref:hypothetical protein n=1 Tax=uncultured Merdimonas sp. TaxID=2023269 RepID=UPI0032080E16